MTGVIQPDAQEVIIPAHNTFQSFLEKKLSQNDQKQYQWMVEYTNIPSEANLALIKSSSEANELIGCTDSSVKNGIATASFAFQLATKQITILQGNVIVPGDKFIQCSHRGEMGGAAAALYYLSLVTEYMEMKRVSIRFGCDSDSVVNIGLTQSDCTNSITDHYNLVRSCRKFIQKLLPIQVIPTKVQGHTDKLLRRKTPMEKLNILCDQYATQMRLKAHRENVVIPEVPNSYWQLSHEGEPICHKLENIIHQNQFRDYWTKQSVHSITPSNIDKIDWISIGTAIKSSSLYKRHFVSKHSTGHCSVGVMMKKWGFRSESRCPRCKTSDESVTHVTVCPHPSALDAWKEQISTFQQWLRSQKTRGDIIEAIIRNLRKLRKSGGIYGHHYQDSDMREAVKEQDNIGWDHFLLGRISNRWSRIQDRHYKCIHSRRTGERWAADLIMKVWKFHWSMWNHRNECLHDTGNHEILGSRRLEKEISIELKKGCALLQPTEKNLFSITMTQVREWSALRKKKWLRTVQASRYSSSIRHRSTQQSRTFMSDWLGSG